jgi:carboxymethylenebutenolidase
MSRRTTAAAALLLSACTLQRSQTGTQAGLPSQTLRSSVVGSPIPGSSAGSLAASAAGDDHMAHMNATDLTLPTPSASLADFQDRPGMPPSANGAAARLKASPRHAEWVTMAWEPGSTDSIMAWVVYPASATARAKAPVVVVVHEIYGLSTWVRGVADQVAADGFIAIAPDFLSKVRGGPINVELADTTASRLIGGVTTADRVKAVTAAANYAMTLPSAQPKYAVIGYCWGGQTVWMNAVNGGVKGFSCGVAYYGAPYSTRGTPATATTPAVQGSVIADSLAKITVPVMLLNGTKDARIGAAMPAIDSIMKAFKKDYTGMNYEGAVHGFLRAQDDPRPTRNEAEEAANLAATKDAWPKTIAFLKKNLGVK